MVNPSATGPGVLALSGKIDSHESPQVKAMLRPMLAAKLPKGRVVLDGVWSIVGSGLALFIEAMQGVQSYGGKFALCGLRPAVRAIFDIARLDQVFQIFPSRQEAWAS